MNRIEMNELSVIVIEPSVTQSHIVERYLHNLGVRTIDMLKNGASALEEMRRTPPDLLISALYLSDMTGTDLVHSMRKESQLADIAFILISSETCFRYLDPIKQAGAVAIIPKPFSQDDLQIALQATLDFIDSPDITLENLEPESLQVLLVDDSDMARKHARRVLEAMGVEQIAEARDGEEGAYQVREHYFDLVITDYNMPRMDGQELAHFIRNSSDQPSLPVIMLTSESNEHRLAMAREAGVSAITGKPFEPNTLKRLLEEVLREA